MPTAKYLRRTLAIMIGLASAHSAADTGPCSGERLPIPGVGSTGGSEARYTLKIQTPKSDDTPAPTVSLMYQSRVGSSLAGVGWSLVYDGSVVFRCPPNHDQEGWSFSVRYADTDKLCLDGKKLVLLEGEYGKDGSSYLTEIFDGRTTFLVGDLDQADARFIVRGSDGSTSIHRTVHQPLGAPAPLYWFRTALIDADGGTVDYSYHVSPAGEVTPQLIRYTGSFDGERRLIGRHFVRFEFAERPDAGTSFLGGGESRYHTRLAGITTGTTQPDGTDMPSTTYQFHYRQSQLTGNSLLERVTGGYYDEEGDYRCRYPTTMEWRDAPLTYSAPITMGLTFDPDSLAPAWSPGQQAPTLSGLHPTGDIDADGRADLLWHHWNGRSELIRVDMRMQSLDRTNIPGDARLLPQSRLRWAPDFRNLGVGDLPVIRSGRITALGWGQGGFNSSLDTGVLPEGDVIALDFNSDGIVDLVRGIRTDAGYRLDLHRGLTDSPAQLRFAPMETLLDLPGNDTYRLDFKGSLQGGQPTLLLYEGERLAYVVQATPVPGGRIHAIARTPDDVGIDPHAIEDGFIFADFNGDGMPDIVFTGRDGTWHVQANADKHFLPAQSTGFHDSRTATGRTATLVADLNRDGADELIFPAQSLTEFCLEVGDTQALCGEELGKIAPHHDFGLYHYDILRIRMDAAGRYRMEHLPTPGLIGQANRSSFGDIDGDGHQELIAPFDPGFVNGRFRQTDGRLSPCPPNPGCGPRVSMAGFVRHDDRRNGNLEALAQIRNTEKVEHRWNYYPLANPHRNLYTLPALESPDRYVDARHFHFRSSMYVVGEYTKQGSRRKTEQRYSYGAAVYNSVGRGFQGFKWITMHDPSTRLRHVHWYRQTFPYTSYMERFWVERDSKRTPDFFAGRPGRNAVASQTDDWHCNGPADHPLTATAGCEPYDHGVFEVLSGNRPRR